MPPPNNPIGMTPDEFIRKIAEAVAAKISTQPPKAFEVKRQNPDGQQRTEAITLPQAIAELSDNMRLANELKKIEIGTMQGLMEVMDENRKVGKAMLKRSRKNEEDDL